MNLENLLKIIASNYNLQAYLITTAKVMIEQSHIQDYENLFHNILKSDKFDFLSKLQDAIDSTQEANNLLKNDFNQIEVYCKGLIEKCRNTAIIAYNSLPENLSYYEFVNKAKYSMFLNSENNQSLFNDKEIKLLDAVGGCKRWLNDYDDNKLLEDMIKNVYKFKRENENNLISAPKFQIGQKI